jgi:hypothetical protein
MESRRYCDPKKTNRARAALTSAETACVI